MLLDKYGNMFGETNKWKYATSILRMRISAFAILQCFVFQKLRARGLIVLTNCRSNLTVYNCNPSEKDKNGIINYFLKKFHLFKVDS